MTRNALFFAGCAGLVFLAGCGGPTSIDLAALPMPVNGAMPVTSGEATQIAAAEALGRIGQPAVKSLADALGDSNAVVRLQACKALAYMGAKAGDAVPALVHTLNDPEETVRIQAAYALGQIGDASLPAVPPLMQMMRGGK